MGRKETVPVFMDLLIETSGTAGIQFAYDRAGINHRHDRGTIVGLRCANFFDRRLLDGKAQLTADERAAARSSSP
jgi:hypothetical protein